MFKIGKVYETKCGTPAKILWIDSSIFLSYNPSYKPKMYVLHEPFTKNEIVLQHDLSGTMSTISTYDLTEKEYRQDFKN